MSEYLSNGREGAGIEAELYDVHDVLHVEFDHVGFDAVCGRAGMYGVESSVGVDEDDVVVVFVNSGRVRVDGAAVVDEAPRKRRG